MENMKIIMQKNRLDLHAKSWRLEDIFIRAIEDKR